MRDVAPQRETEDTVRPRAVNGASHPRKPRPDLRAAPARPQVSRPAEPDADRIERLCLERGLKMTGQRRTVARVLSESVDHPDVEELYRRASLLDARISIATVYRTVRLFEEKGILQRRDFGSGRARYEPAEHGHHYHVIDVETGKVVEFTSAEHERLVRAVADQLGFEVVSMRLEVFGRHRPGDDTGPDPAPPGRRAKGAR